MRTRRQALLLGGVAALCQVELAWSQTAPASTSGQQSWQRLRPYLGNPRLVGEDKFTYWGFEVYHASLWTGSNPLTPAQWQTQRLALELRYLRDFAGKDIAQRSVEEMHAQSPLPSDKAQSWLKQLNLIFPNIKKGDSLTGIYLPEQGAQFLYDNQSVGEIKDTELAQRFFGIWLAPQTSAPKLRQRLFADATP